ncbi:ABC-type transport auxiliary lipoprotein family protein [Sulfurimonas sp.]|uniref:ABC-type transport auxiliary lipoprotein family protein n=1 Tax=Sulfurimonas sp. TaxID=2022749 RepID=UPI0025F4B3B2|nr:ABC-type transport auxiliary lipoprotein family protein [Sulfurimonas sp.]MDD5158247.1 ABC-type transport auxiliary lipoprotein family protein [Sulfurimonas sp.]
MKQILIAISLLFLSGCTMTKPYITEYKISTKEVQIKHDVGGCRDKTMKIAQAFSEKSLMSSMMDYTQSGNKVFSYTESQWQETPNHAITAYMYNEIKESAIFKSVLNSRSVSKSDMILEITIEEFMQHYSFDMKELYSSVVVSLAVVDAKTNSIVATKTFKSKVDSKKLNADGGVEALSSALADISEKSIEWLSGVCK